eukprot:20723-Heterococcus_DN1.PRE.2
MNLATLNLIQPVSDSPPSSSLEDLMRAQRGLTVLIKLRKCKHGLVTRSHALRTGARALLIGARAHKPMKRLPMRPRALAVRSTGVRCFAMQAGSSSGGGRTSAAVTQDTDKRSSAGKASSNDKLDLNPVKGTRDMYPEDMRLRTWLFGHWRAVAAEYGFEEYDSPVLESEALYVRKSGEEVTQQLFNFLDKGDRRVALRPEMTPSLARMIMARRNGITLPVKWFSLPQCWRYERMTRGRRREHYQWNMDIWGVQGVAAEAELLSAITTFFSNVGLTSSDVGIKVNSRAVLSEIMTKLGVPTDKHAATCVLVDKLEKVPLASLQADMTELGLEESIVTKLLDVMKMKTIDDLEQAVGSSESSPAVAELRQLFDLADAYGYADWLVFDASVVRGLAYYTGIVFEGFDRSGTLRAICGGGRYDELLTSFGGESLPAAGFGFGDAVIVELLKDKQLLPDTTAATVDTMVFAFSPELQLPATKVAAVLRRAGCQVDLIIELRKAKWVYKHADRRQARFVCLIAPQEWEQAGQLVNVKDMKTSEQTTVELNKLADYIQQKLQQTAAAE